MKKARLARNRCGSNRRNRLVVVAQRPVEKLDLDFSRPARLRRWRYLDSPRNRRAGPEDERPEAVDDSLSYLEAPPVARDRAGAVETQIGDPGGDVAAPAFRLDGAVHHPLGGNPCAAGALELETARDCRRWGSRLFGRGAPEASEGTGRPHAEHAFRALFGNQHHFLRAPPALGNHGEAPHGIRREIECCRLAQPSRSSLRLDLIDSGSAASHRRNFELDLGPTEPGHLGGGVDPDRRGCERGGCRRQPHPVQKDEPGRASVPSAASRLRAPNRRAFRGNFRSKCSSHHRIERSRAHRHHIRGTRIRTNWPCRCRKDSTLHRSCRVGLGRCGCSHTLLPARRCRSGGQGHALARCPSRRARTLRT